MAKTLSEQKRAFDALKGVLYPNVGDRARWIGTRLSRSKWDGAVVKVVRVSATGKTIWTRFVSAQANKRYGSGPHRWERWTDDGPYCCSNDGIRPGPGGGAELYGELHFPRGG